MARLFGWRPVDQELMVRVMGKPQQCEWRKWDGGAEFRCTREAAVLVVTDEDAKYLCREHQLEYLEQVS